MLLPQNGKVVILDDKIEQALPLINILSKNRIPFTYHTEDEAQLPSTPYEDIRLLFLDINLTDGVNEEAIKAQLQSTLQKLIKPNTTYMLAVWSIRENEYKDLLNDLFDTRIPLLKPLVKISLAKSSLFRINLDTGHYEADDNIDLIKELNKRIIAELKNTDAFKILIEWENLVNKSSSQVIDKFTNLITKDENWSKNIKHIFYKMAYAQLGKNLKTAKEFKVVQAALKTLNNSLSDKLDSLLHEEGKVRIDTQIKKNGVNFYKEINGQLVRLKWEDLNTNVIFIGSTEKGRNKIVDKLKGGNPADTAIIDGFKEIYRIVPPKLNTELVISFKKLNNLSPGNVFHKIVTGAKKRKLLATYFRDIHKKNGTAFVTKDLSKILFVELECTPICDYSQKKWLRSRLLPGILYPTSFHSLLNQDIDSLYKEIPPFEYNDGEVYRLVFDYRLFKSIGLDDHIHHLGTFIFRLKAEVLVDIQSRISAHVSRLGITTII